MDHNYGYANVLKHLDKIMEKAARKISRPHFITRFTMKRERLMK